MGDRAARRAEMYVPLFPFARPNVPTACAGIRLGLGSHSVETPSLSGLYNKGDRLVSKVKYPDYLQELVVFWAARSLGAKS